MAVTKPPSLLRINGRDVELRPLPEVQLPDAYGQWSEEDSLIVYRDKLSPIDIRDVVLHEAFHAIRSTQGREYGGKVEEDYVRSLATGLIGVLRDNPEFARWLMRIPKPKTPT